MAEYTFENVLFATVDDAWNVFKSMRQMIDTYGYVTVADFYDLAGITTNSDFLTTNMDEHHGWQSIFARVYPRKNGFMIKFDKRPIYLGDGYSSHSKELDYCARDIETTKKILNRLYGRESFLKKTFNIPKIKDVIFNDPATIILWTDGTKTVVKTQNGEPFDPEKGFAMAVTKKAFGNQGNYFETVKKYTNKYEYPEVECMYPKITIPKLKPGAFHAALDARLRRLRYGTPDVEVDEECPYATKKGDE